MITRHLFIRLLPTRSSTMVGRAVTVGAGGAAGVGPHSGLAPVGAGAEPPLGKRECPRRSRVARSASPPKIRPDFWWTALAPVLVLACGDSASPSPAAGAGGAETAGAGGSSTGGSATGGSGVAGASGGQPTDSGSGGSDGTSGPGPDGGDAEAGPTKASICPPGPYAASPLPAGNVTAQQVCGGLIFTEGPVWFATEKTLFFSNFQDENAAVTFIGDIMRYKPGGTCETFITGT